MAICTIVLALSFILFPIGKGTGLAHFLLYNEQVFKPKALSSPVDILLRMLTGDPGHIDDGRGFRLLNFLRRNGALSVYNGPLDISTLD